MGEFELIYHYFTQGFPNSADTVLGIGDDCSIVQPPANMQLLQSIDTQVANVHFFADTPADLIAQRALRCAASDLAAMGATPQGFHLALTLPQANAAWLESFARGLRESAHELGLTLLGGDTTRGQELVISVAVQGWVPAGQALTRSGAQIGDEVWVSDIIGRAALALPLVQQNPADYSGLARHYYYPEVQFTLGQKLRTLASACMDISDGLLQDAGHLAKASQVSLQLEATSIPTAADFGSEDWLRCLTGGDDYQLLFTAPAAKHHEILNLSLQHSGLCCIGRVIAATDQAVVLSDQGQTITLDSALGFQHF